MDGLICTLPCCQSIAGRHRSIRAIVNGETKTGNTTMRIDAGMDTGEMLLQQELPIGADETAPELMGRLAEAGGPLMVETLRGIAAGTIVGQAQNHAEATTAPILKREDGLIDWSMSARQIYNRMRGFKPWPDAYTQFRSQTCHLSGVPVSKDEGDAELAHGFRKPCPYIRRGAVG